MGRQPFVVVPNPSGVDGVWMFTARGVSGLTVGEVLTSLIALTRSTARSRSSSSC